MTLFLKKGALGIICCFSLYYPGIAQNVESISDPVLTRKSIIKATEKYVGSLGTYFHLYNGAEYIDVDRFIKGHAFYGENEWSKEDILYDSILFKDISLKYDIYRDIVIVSLNYGRQLVSNLSLHNEKISNFTLQGRRFAMVHDNIYSKPQIYELLYDGKVKAIARKEKVLYERLEDTELKREFLDRNFYYVKKENVYYPIKTKAALFKLFSGSKHDIRDLLRENAIKFRKQKERAIVLATQLYDQHNP